MPQVGIGTAFLIEVQLSSVNGATQRGVENTLDLGPTFGCQRMRNSEQVYYKMIEMDPASQIEITKLLKAWRGGDAGAFDRLTALVYVELKKIARGYTRFERPDATIQATALVNEAYLKLAGTNVDWQNRAHFFAVSAQVMRRILVDGARARTRGKRGGGVIKIQLDEAPDLGDVRSRELIAVDGALAELAAFDPRKAKVVELRFFGGLTVKESAEVLKVSDETVLRDWRLARSWLMRELTPSK